MIRARIVSFQASNPNIDRLFACNRESARVGTNVYIYPKTLRRASDMDISIRDSEATYLQVITKTQIVRHRRNLVEFAAYI